MKDALLEIENVMKSYNGTFKIKIEVFIFLNFSLKSLVIRII